MNPTAATPDHPDHPDHTEPHPPLIHIVVEVDGKNRPVTFDHSPVTGSEIRAGAGAPTTDDLARLFHGKPSGGNIASTDKSRSATATTSSRCPPGR